MSSRIPRRTPRRTLARGAAAVLTALTLAATATACGDDGTSSGGEGDGTGTITFWDNNGGPRTDIWNEIIEAFEAENPDIDVEYVGVPISEVQSKYDAAIQGGEGLPDVGGLSTAYLSNLVAQGALDPVTDRLAESGLEETLMPNMLESIRTTVGEGDEVYQVPTSANQGVLWYRTDLFDAAGLRPPATWDAFFAAADELTDRGANRFGFTLRGGEGSIAQALDMMYAQSGIDSFWDGDTTTVNDPANVEALRNYVDLYNTVTPEADLNNDFTNMVATFTGGEVGMLQHNLGSYADHVAAFGEDGVAGLPMPTSEEGGPHTFVSNPVDGLGLFRSSDNKEAAWRFIEFAVSHEMNSRWNESAGQIPSNLQALEDPWIAEAPPTRAAVEALSDENTTIVDLPYHLPDWNNISKADTEPNFQRLLLGEMSAQEFADDLAERLDEAQAEWQEQRR
ncbi:ABC transporter substrate-binding protein [Streptomyces radicis]|uniref:Sugar ABC transporter substrate-binding protein n=1 Tax=Streptomyces radicis TaxID=1750517 RepID=A0A3A9VRI5_9ACTN|nr:sugar ABC transporter substrate-binding protein [Streptomyces radicis]RKN03655.1 sugar ABC transporter substrate-binding protein [Streptomyces radicis]RKN13499.1 sugar ABC transporter substrate-binding protein [Streptomyces radicis]